MLVDDPDNAERYARLMIKLARLRSASYAALMAMCNFRDDPRDVEAFQDAIDALNTALEKAHT